MLLVAPWVQDVNPQEPHVLLQKCEYLIEYTDICVEYKTVVASLFKLCFISNFTGLSKDYEMCNIQK